MPRFALPQSDQFRGILCILVATLLLSIMTALSKYLTARYPVSEVVFYRYLFATFPLIPIVLAHGGLKVYRTSNFKGHLWRALVGCCCISCYFYSASRLPLAEATSLSYTNPIFITLLSVLILKEKVEAGMWMAVLAGFAGVLLIARPAGLSVDPGAVAGVVGAFCQAAVTLGVHKLSRQDGALTTLMWFSTLAAVLTSIPLLFGYKPPTPEDFLLLFLCGMCGFGGQSFITLAYKMAVPSKIGHFNYASIIWATLLGFILFGHFPTLHVWVGAAIVVASGYYIVHRERLLRKQPITPP